MSTTATATASIEVACDPKTAFTVFTRDIGTWWKRGTYYWIDPQRGLALWFEPQVGGRLVEVYDAETGEGHELGRVKIWQPGERLLFTWRTPDWPANETTEVDVRFEATEAGSRVTLEHTGWERLGAAGSGLRDGYAGGWAELLGFFAARAGI